MAQEISGQPEAATLPEWIRILPLGKVELVDSRQPFEVDKGSLAAMVADFESRGVDLVIDYEHQSLHGERAPAAGWIKHLEAREDGLWAQVEWTSQAQEYLKRREYRYFSPVLRLDPETRKPALLMQVGLTNVPAIKHLPPLVAKCGGNRLVAGGIMGGREEKAKMMEKVKCLVGLNREAEDGVVWGKVLEVFKDLAAALKLPGDASASQVKGAVEALKAGAQHLGEVQEELQVLKCRLAEENAAQVVAEALKAGKISPAQKGWAQEYFRQDPEGFRTYVAKAPKLVPTGEELRLIGKDRQEGGNLLPEELAICRSLNLPPEEYLKAKAQTGSAQ
ncbi:MAG: phage protease [Desulfobaccales bacterium]|nr:phage protease [Desulfobaccales bacterium]